MIVECFSGRWDSRRIGRFCEALSQRYPFVSRAVIGRSVMGRPIWLLTLGSGAHRALFHGAHHANEWITAPLLLRFVSELAAAADYGKTIGGADARALLHGSSLAVIPAVNPDGIDLVTGALRSGNFFAAAKSIAAGFPDIPFPSGWKANIEGIDLNLQYPADWDRAKEIKASLGFDRPAPRDFPGQAPLAAPEARALYDFTLSYSPALTLSYHTQGREIYWDYQQKAPSGSREIAEDFAAVSGYAVADVPFVSSFAGYKDWYIDRFRRPGFTIEAGSGENPLPAAQFRTLYAENLGIFVRALRA